MQLGLRTAGITRNEATGFCCSCGLGVSLAGRGGFKRLGLQRRKAEDRSQSSSARMRTVQSHMGHMRTCAI